MVVAVARLSLYIPHAHSLKEKRAVIRRIVDRTQARLKVHVSEVGAQDTWQSAQLGFAVVGGEAHVIEAVRDEVVRAIEGMVMGEGEVTAVDRDTIRFGAGQEFSVERAKYAE
ncbi:MAG TPA: DUF503 domain-containing protein [Kofleriaceae bacterium]|nr:DUF503 domain-containing protein [Kofleriaceae bacterium]